MMSNDRWFINILEQELKKGELDYLFFILVKLTLRCNSHDPSIDCEKCKNKIFTSNNQDLSLVLMVFSQGNVPLLKHLDSISYDSNKNGELYTAFSVNISIGDNTYNHNFTPLIIIQNECTLDTIGYTDHTFHCHSKDVFSTLVHGDRSTKVRLISRVDKSWKDTQEYIQKMLESVPDNMLYVIEIEPVHTCDVKSFKVFKIISSIEIFIVAMLYWAPPMSMMSI